MDSKNCNNFISYIGLEEHEMQPLGSSRRNSLNENNVKLLPGEVPIAEAHNVLMFSPVSDLKQGISGILSVTNFKLTFITTDDNNTEDFTRQQNHLYGYTDTCLSNIDEVYLILGDKKKKLVPGNTVPSKIKGIFIICKNLRTWSFSFHFSPNGHGKNLLTALLHHAFPSRHQLLFAYDYSEAYYSTLDKGIHLFRDISDWKNELERTLQNSYLRRSWRLSTANIKFQLSASLSQFVIVPASVSDNQLADAVKHFQGNRPPVWCWSNELGASLVKMAELSPTVSERTQENIMLENIRKSHPQKVPPVVIDLNKDITVKQVASGFTKFINLCSPENIRQFWVQDNNFYSLLESSKWLKYISCCLQKAVETCDQLKSGYSVILQETTARDVCCIISSLVQLLLDPYFRSITGFQSLLQKEWIAAGHPFCDRLGHIITNNANKCPLFLLYLDCVWQLCKQFPTEFEFTETYLTTLWDTAHISVFETFMFNCERDRAVAAMDPNTPLVLRSVWDWREQFNDQDILLFYNPLFNSQRNEAGDKLYMRALYSISCLELWTQCYFRWIPPLEIQNGGQNHIELFVKLLQNEISQLKVNATGACESTVDKISTFLVQMNIDSFYPFSDKKPGNTVSTPIMNSSIIAAESLLDTQSLLTASD
ncbi:myotubularin-related protein 12 [Prorops nasuta]|uniref:myotubularin-related protein 12 n=1 Tax=Prorops nasuta TaxID=863751 RepID=UPI0034CEE9AD